MVYCTCSLSLGYDAPNLSTLPGAEVKSMEFSKPPVKAVQVSVVCMLTLVVVVFGDGEPLTVVVISCTLLWF